MNRRSTLQEHVVDGRSDVSLEKGSAPLTFGEARRDFQREAGESLRGCDRSRRTRAAARGTAASCAIEGRSKPSGPPACPVSCDLFPAELGLNRPPFPTVSRGRFLTRVAPLRLKRRVERVPVRRNNPQGLGRREAASAAPTHDAAQATACTLVRLLRTGFRLPLTRSYVSVSSSVVASGAFFLTDSIPFSAAALLS